MIMNFENKVIIVTGGSRGIGAAVAVKLSKLRAKIVIVGRNQDKLKEVSEICEQNGSKPLVINADVTKDEDTKRIISDSVKHFGKLDVLVNNVGIFDTVSISDPNAMEKFDHIINTNLRSAVHLVHLAVPYLIETKGNIVNVSSSGSKGIFLPTNFSYCTSKAGLDHFSRSVALELAPKGIRVNCVNPGPVRTNFMDHTTLSELEKQDVFDNMSKTTALGKISEPEEIANLILFLASEDKGKSITGSSYVIDNGILLK